MMKCSCLYGMPSYSFQLYSYILHIGISSDRLQSLESKILLQGGETPEELCKVKAKLDSLRDKLEVLFSASLTILVYLCKHSKKFLFISWYLCYKMLQQFYFEYVLCA